MLQEATSDTLHQRLLQLVFFRCKGHTNIFLTGNTRFPLVFDSTLHVQYVLAAIEKTEKIIVLRSTSNKNTVVYWLASSLLHYNSNIYRWRTQNVCVQIVRSSKVNKCRDIKKGLKMSKGKTDAAARNQNGADNTMTKRKRDKGKKQYMYIKHHTDNKD
jgi:hypothetical protein